MSKTLEKKVLPTDNSALKAGVSKDEDLRSGNERRKFLYTAYIPDRRSGKDRRCACNRSLAIDENRSETDNPRYYSGIMC